jgi:hypothetical protein
MIDMIINLEGKLPVKNKKSDVQLQPLEQLPTAHSFVCVLRTDSLTRVEAIHTYSRAGVRTTYLRMSAVLLYAVCCMLGMLVKKKTDSSITLPLTPIPTDPTPSTVLCSIVSTYAHEMGVGGKWGLEPEY